jgi:hypothetical protein
MPYTEKEKKLHAALVKKYGPKKAEQVYHAMLNSMKHEAIFGAKSKRRRQAKKTNKS